MSISFLKDYKNPITRAKQRQGLQIGQGNSSKQKQAEMNQGAFIS
jgi:hypothetical protein